METNIVKPSRYHKIWTLKEKGTLRRLIEEGKTVDEIASLLNRNIKAVQIKKSKLKIKKRIRQISNGDGIVVHLGKKGKYKKVIPNGNQGEFNFAEMVDTIRPESVENLQERYIKAMSDKGLNLKIIITNSAV